VHWRTVVHALASTGCQIGRHDHRVTLRPSTQVAELVSAPYAQYARLILKVSHYLEANLSLMLFGLANGVNTMRDALSMEAASRRQQPCNYSLP
jgi:hypothetical protein